LPLYSSYQIIQIENETKLNEVKENYSKEKQNHKTELAGHLQEFFNP